MKVLVAEDDIVSAEFVKAVLEESGHEVLAAPDGRAAMAMFEAHEPHVVICDWEMPHLNGLELCRAIRERNTGRYVYLILLTSREGTRNLVSGLSAGADEFMSKPLIPEELRVRLRTAHRILSMETRDLAIFAMAKLAESRDTETGAHLERVRQYSKCIAAEMSRMDKYRGEVTPGFIRLIYLTSPLHDIGKVSIPDHVLLKPGRLDDREYEIMKTHAQAGAETLDKALCQHPEADFLRMARDIAGAHHERYDGTGYPRGLCGDEIPLPARIFCLADVYDALVSKRVYKDAFTHDVARGIILKGEGSHFDPDVIQAFLRCEDAFIRISGQFEQEAALCLGAEADVLLTGAEARAANGAEPWRPES